MTSIGMETFQHILKRHRNCKQISLVEQPGVAISADRGIYGYISTTIKVIKKIFGITIKQIVFLKNIEKKRSTSSNDDHRLRGQEPSSLHIIGRQEGLRNV